MKRFYHQAVIDHFHKNRQMLFLMGPRQVGKTTLALELKSEWPDFHYFNYDNLKHRKIITDEEVDLGETLGLQGRDPPLPFLAFDEFHKYRNWKNYLKGLYDVYPWMMHILVTGSARLDVYQRGADSLMGRYFRYRIHPLSVRELLEPEMIPRTLRPEPCQIDQEQFETLLKFGGFPDPFLRGEERYLNQWRERRNQQLFREDLRDLSRVREVAQLEILAEFLRESVGSNVSCSSLAKKVGVTHPTIREWIQRLTSLYYCFEVRPWSGKLARTLTKEPKYYMVDWSSVDDPGARAENFVASHLLKAVHFWSDHGMGRFCLHYLRNTAKQEVDFCVTRNDNPWMLVEVKLNHDYSISPNLIYFQKQINAPYALQVVIGLRPTHDSCFIDSKPRIVPASSFLSQLV